MRLPSETLDALQRGPAEFDWPLPTAPRSGRIYRLQVGRELEYTFAVVRAEETEGGWRVCARLHSDPVHLLGKKSGYTHVYSHSLQVRDAEAEPEPEAIDPAELGRISGAVRAQRESELAEILGELGAVYAELERIHKKQAAKSIRSELFHARGRIAAAQNRLGSQKAASERAAA